MRNTRSPISPTPFPAVVPVILAADTTERILELDNLLGCGQGPLEDDSLTGGHARLKGNLFALLSSGECEE